MTVEFVDPAICPLCAERNDCAMVDGGKSCWCCTASIPREALERIPVEHHGLACICRECGSEIASAGIKLNAFHERAVQSH